MNAEMDMVRIIEQGVQIGSQQCHSEAFKPLLTYLQRQMEILMITVLSLGGRSQGPCEPGSEVPSQPMPIKEKHRIIRNECFRFGLHVNVNLTLCRVGPSIMLSAKLRYTIT